jgi:RNA polymerase sigma-70 factor, ECF subfamily
MSGEIPDSDLVRLAGDGDPVAFRLLVERHQAAVRARARSLCGNPSGVDDVVQETFLRAFIGLDRLRDPGRFAGWLGSITANVCRGLRRRTPVTLLPDWPEPLHPLAARGLPSADDLDRADTLRAAVAGLPAGQRRAVALYYYADLPAGQIAEQAGAARASLHKARLKLRAYLVEHRPDLVPDASRRTLMATVRIAGAERRIPPGPEPIGFPSHVIMLADDAGRRELPIWTQHLDPRRLLQLFEPATDLEALAVAITAGAPVRVADSVLGRLAVTVPDDGGPVPLPEPAAALAVLSPGRRPRYEPRNLAFADGLDRWVLGGTFTGHASHSHWQDYSCSAADGTAALYSTVPEPAGFAFLGQEIFADDYRGAVITFSGEIRAQDGAADTPSRAGLFLRVVRGRDARQPLTERESVDDPDNTTVTVPDGRGWASAQVTALIPDDASTVVFGVFLAGRGRLETRNAQLAGS